MSRFIEGEDRHQATLFPVRPDDYVAEDSEVRVIDVFIDDLAGFQDATQCDRPTSLSSCHPVKGLRLRLSQPGTVIPPAGTRSPARSGEEFSIEIGKMSAVTAVPLPMACWLFCSGLIGLIGLGRHKKAA